MMRSRICEARAKSHMSYGLSLQARLKVVIKSLLGDEHWHPGFAGLSGLAEASK